MNQNAASRLPLRIVVLTLLASLLLLVAAGCGGGGGGGGGGGNNTTTRIRGVVFDSEDGDSEVEGATVTIGGVTATTRTRDNANPATGAVVGSFEIRNPAQGARTAVITPAGGQPQTVAFDPPIGPGDNGTIQLFINIGQISGRVLRPDGQPAVNAFLSIGSTGETLTVSQLGTFLSPPIPKGVTQVFVVEGTASRTIDVTVVNGETALGDIQLVDDPNPNPPGAPFTIAGVVSVTGVGTPSGTTVVLERNGVQIEVTTTGADGSYRFYVPIGAYTVRAVRNGFVETVSSPFQVADPNAPVTINLTMNPVQ